jgi:hypothetical protein
LVAVCHILVDLIEKSRIVMKFAVAAKPEVSPERFQRRLPKEKTGARHHSF